jgi:UDP:flavonoid glycosyltransferase YjiC (YdhE family)
LTNDTPADATLPEWWDEVATRQRPVVLATQGTFETDPGQLIGPTLVGLAGEDLLVIVAGVRSAEALGPGGIPGNARIAPFIPFGLAMPQVDLFVTNGGFGGVHYALAHGVPLAIGASRVARVGAGINLKTARPPAAQVRDAVRMALQDPRYRQAARRLQAELAQHDAPTEAALLLERLAVTNQPVFARRVASQRSAELVTRGGTPKDHWLQERGLTWE